MSTKSFLLLDIVQEKDLSLYKNSLYARFPLIPPNAPVPRFNIQAGSLSCDFRLFWSASIPAAKNIIHPTQKPCILQIYKSSASGRRVRRKSLVISKLSQLLAILGATFRRLGTMPLYSPLRPSWATIVLTASTIPLY